MIQEKEMNDSAPFIKCRKCGHAFQPDMKTNKAWPCPSCQEKNPNLKRHYRSVADLCILGLIVTAVLVAVKIQKVGLFLDMILSVVHAVLLLVTIIVVYKSKTPWADAAAKALIWTVFGLGILFNVGFPFGFPGIRNIPLIVVYAIVFPYIFWLNSQAGKCTVSQVPRPLGKQES